MAGKVAPSFQLDAGFSQLKSQIVERTGHFYYQDKDDLLWERVRKRLRITGCRDTNQYLERLNDPVLGPTEWARLESDITIGETFFFRYAEQFAALRERILPDIIARRAGERRLRIWSAGCATGAEPYSIAILLKQLLGDELANWRISIIGSDINDAFLDTARRAVFGRWALRTLSAEETSALFEPAEAKDQWRLKKEYRTQVRFERHNLLSLIDGTSPLQFTDFDLVLCRNVLIYFHPTMVVRIVQALSQTMRDEGWMLLGHAEPNPAFADFLKLINLPGTVAYRRSLEGDVTAQTNILAGNLPARAPPVLQMPAHRVARSPGGPPEAQRSSRPARPLSPPLSPPPEPQPGSLPQRPDSLLAEVRALADAGRFRTAEELCRRALLSQPLNPVLHYYEGLIAQAVKNPAGAEKAFRRSIYLDKSFAMAHYHLGLLLLADGRYGTGRRSLANAARIAAGMPDEAVLDEADGLTAHELQGLVRLHLRAAPPSIGEN
ncbi:CheR family methyltransferase [Microvirga rosea]|uniref:CheR family methyltransferase n=1 Tax=Microvirga rosea TaxID=2715425 RepID=UPI001D0A4771|nr:protein-glutamate O-methyltransferase CheR [Microvirga rosea]MCB8819639.1 protein-glutamate methyltransferase [Microvirga rosea]